MKFILILPCLFFAFTATPTARASGEQAENLDAVLDKLLAIPGGLTSEEVAQRAETTSNDVLARRSEVDGAQAAVSQAFIAYLPRIAATGRYARLSDDAPPVVGNVVIAPGAPANQLLPANAPLANAALSFAIPRDQWTFQATLSVPISDYALRFVQAYSAASHSEKAASISEHSARVNARADAKLIYYAWAGAKLQHAVAEQALIQARGHLTDDQHAFTSGVVSRADVLRVESQVAQSEQLVSTADHLVAVLEEELRTVMHAPDGGPAPEIGEDIRAAMDPLFQNRNLPELVREAQAARLELRALDESVAAVDQQVQVATAGAFPRVDLLGEVTDARPNTRFLPLVDEFRSTWTVGGQISWAPNDLAASLAVRSAAHARAKQMRSERAALSDAIRVEVAQGRQAVADAEAALSTSARGLAAAEESYRVRHALLVAGTATSIELTDAETDLTRARFDAIRARIDLRIGRLRLMHALGQDVSAR